MYRVFLPPIVGNEGSRKKHDYSDSPIGFFSEQTSTRAYNARSVPSRPPPTHKNGSHSPSMILGSCVRNCCTRVLSRHSQHLSQRGSRISSGISLRQRKTDDHHDYCCYGAYDERHGLRRSSNQKSSVSICSRGPIAGVISLHK